MKTAYLGLGSNLDTPAEQIRRARKEINTLAGVSELAFSDLFQSAPMGPADQPDYLNAVMAIRTSLPPLELLHALQQIELDHGRIRIQRWGARTLDLDVLLYGDEHISTPELTVPHPGMAERAFVLYPLHDCNPDLVIPGIGKLSDLLKQQAPTGLIRLSSHEHIA